MWKYSSLPALMDQFHCHIGECFSATASQQHCCWGIYRGPYGTCRWWSLPACVNIVAQCCLFVLWQAKLCRSEVLRLPFCPALLYNTAFPLWCFSRYWIDSTLIGPRQYKCNLIRSLRIAESAVWTPQHAHGLFLIWFSHNFMHKGNELQIVMWKWKAIRRLPFMLKIPWWIFFPPDHICVKICCRVLRNHYPTLRAIISEMFIFLSSYTS